VFLAAAAVMVVALALARRLQDVPLRETAALSVAESEAPRTVAAR
jgi:hypothetical protein